MDENNDDFCHNKIDYIFRINIPIGSKIIIPAIDRDIDSEFELLLENNTIITINKITNDKSFNVLNMTDDQNICVKVINLIDGTKI